MTSCTSCGCDHDVGDGVYVHASRDRGALSVRTNVATHPSGTDVVRVLAEHLGLHEPLLKASEDRDWKYPDLDVLITRARRDWMRWGAQLVRAVEQMQADGRLQPLTPEREASLRELFAEHRAWLVVRFTGLDDLLGTPAPPTAPGYQRPSHDEIAYRLGRRLDAIRGLIEQGPPIGETFEDVVKRAMAMELDANDAAAMQYAKRRAAVFMRKPSQQFEGDVTVQILDDDRHLSEVQLDKIRTATEAAVAAGTSTQEFARQLRDLADGTLTNDMDRVARTELRFAHAYGAYRTLKQQALDELGESDPLVYKITSPTACAQCVRIWGRNGSKRYRLSEIEAWEREDGNFKKPAKDWRATIGPVHPNCFPAGVPITTSRGSVPIERIAVGDLVLTHKGRWRRVTRTMRRLHDGMVVRVNGVPVTPEHPFLTTRGWVAAQALNRGDHLLDPSQIGFAHAKDAPSLLDEVRFLGNVLGALASRAMPLSAVHLDSDKLGWNRKVDQVAVHLKSRLGDHAASFERVLEVLLQRGSDAPRLWRDHSTHLLIGADASASGCMCIGHASAPLLWRQLDVHVEPRLARVAGAQAALDESAYQRGSIDVESSADLQHRHALVEVHPPDVLHHDVGARSAVQSLAFGHGRFVVHNFSVHEDESYVADGLVVHNCSCGPLLLYVDDLHDQMIAAVNRLLEAGKANGTVRAPPPR